MADRKAHNRGARTKGPSRKQAHRLPRADRERLLALLEQMDDEALEHFLGLAMLLSHRSKSSK